jgi:mannose/cellobiose epimerase-like protein (N-acyl-D-glucosamine 2-epimerase family)
MVMPLRRIVAVLLTLLALGSPAAAQPLASYAPAVERNLTQAIVGFWYPRGIDADAGGYLVDFDAQGRFKGDAPKMIVTQARMLWLSSRLLREGRGGPGMHEAARQGYRFLMDHMWDKVHGGFYWEVDRTGATVTAPLKHLYGQAFGLYALSEYARATGDGQAMSDATALFDLLEARAHDRVHGGYLEFFAEDWGPAPADVTPYLGVPAGLKSMNTHLHLLEAVTAFYRASGLPRARERLEELATIESTTVVRKTVAACTDQYRPDWAPVLTPATARASYGHDLENIWLLADAYDALGRPVAPLLDLFRAVFENALAHGEDRDGGGFFDSGPLGADADRRGKTWWVQAEALVSALTMYRLTGEERYADVFRRTWQFVDQHQTDWTSGEWWETVAPDGSTGGDKAHRWKAGYHNGRAMLECLRLLHD